MAGILHLLGLALACGLSAGAVWLWSAYPDLVSRERLWPWRDLLMTWRYPILAMSAFLLLSLLEWIGGRFGSK